MPEGVHTGLNLAPAIQQAIMVGLADGQPLKTLASEHGVSRNAVTALADSIASNPTALQSANNSHSSKPAKDALPSVVEHWKFGFQETARSIIDRSLAKYSEALEADKVDPDKLVLNAAILVDKVIAVEQMGKLVQQDAPRISVSIQSMTAYLQTVTTDSPATPALPAQHDQPAIDVPMDPGGGGSTPVLPCACKSTAARPHRSISA